MQTYGNFTNGYRPHLDAADFMGTVRIGALVAYGLSMAFSIRGNYKGLLQTLEKDTGLWLLAIAVGITLAGAVLSMLINLRVDGLTRKGRRLIYVGVAGFFFISTMLNLVGFTAGEEAQKTNAVQQHPDVMAANRELNEIVKRQQQYGLSSQEKSSLAAREREQREWVRQVEMRVWKEQGAGAQSTAEKALGENAGTARALFAVAPEFAIIALGPVLVLLWGLAGTSESESVAGTMELKRANQQRGQQIVYVPANGYQPVAAVQPNSQVQTPAAAQPVPSQAPSGTNGKLEVAPIGVNQPPAWNPF